MEKRGTLGFYGVYASEDLVEWESGDESLLPEGLSGNHREGGVSVPDGTPNGSKRNIRIVLDFKNKYKQTKRRVGVDFRLQRLPSLNQTDH